MIRKLWLAVFLLTAISIVLGAFGHASQWERHIHPALTGVAPATVQLLALIWYWVSGTMLVFGLMLIRTLQRMGRGDRNLRFVPWLIGAFYAVNGAYAALTVGPFFWLFVVQALLLFVCTWVLQGTAGAAQAA
jgi:hypothetical protein